MSAGTRAALIYQEGTAEEQIYPFVGARVTLGRGRENDIQLKNDARVARYHCHVERRDEGFFIADLRSANGTLVNGELIQERRLVGGEEILVGKTSFRFRVLG